MLLSKVVRVVGLVWLWLAVGLVLLGYAAIILKSGFKAWLEVVSPTNLWNYISVALTVLPGIGLLRFADWLEQRSGTTTNNNSAPPSS